MHLLGLHGMPRRVYTYQAGLGWEGLNLLATVGASTLALGILATLVNAVYADLRGARAPADPWGGGTLEWSVPSPPPAGNFHAIPVVHCRESLWTPAPAGEPTHVAGLAMSVREQLVTTALDADPDHRSSFPKPSPWPFVAAVMTGLLLGGSVFTQWAIVWFTPPAAVALVLWFWPRREDTARELALEKRP